jgi:hypothetical protein
MAASTLVEAALHNVRALYASATPEEKTQGEQWYVIARAQCKHIAMRYNLPVEIVAAIVAVLSPNCPWDRNLKDAENLLRCYANGWPIEWVSAVTYRRNVWRAWDIRDKLDASLLHGPKVEAFYHCIVNPNSHHVCIDRHIYCATTGIEYTTETMPHITKEAHKAITRAICKVAAENHVIPHRIQATIWIIRRRILAGSRNQIDLPLR